MFFHISATTQFTAFFRFNFAFNLFSFVEPTGHPPLFFTAALELAAPALVLIIAVETEPLPSELLEFSVHVLELSELELVLPALALALMTVVLLLELPESENLALVALVLGVTLLQ